MKKKTKMNDDKSFEKIIINRIKIKILNLNKNG